jgi:hypothetical protein
MERDVPSQSKMELALGRRPHRRGSKPREHWMALGPPPHQRLTTAWSRRAGARGSCLAVCAVHAVMLGSESLLSRCAWSRRTREAQGRHREVGSEGSVERRCGARDTNRIRGVVQSGRAGTRQQSPPSTGGLCLINPASRHRRYDSLPREICGVSWIGLRVEQSSLTAPQKSAEGIVGPAQAKLVRHPKAERRGNR